MSPKDKKSTKEIVRLDPLVLGRLSPIYILVLMIGWWAFMVYAYYRRPGLLFDIPSLVRFLSPETNLSFGWFWGNLKLAGIFSWFIFLGLGLGSLLLTVLKIPLENRLEWAGMSVGLGWGILGMAFAGLGFLNLWSPYPVYVSLAVLSVGLAVAMMRRKIGAGFSGETRLWSSIEKVMVDLIILVMVLDLIGAMMPEIFYDAQVYHLAMPELYWIKGGIFPTPFNLYSGFPQLMEMLYGLALPFGDRLCHFIHWGFGTLTALLICGFCLRLRRPVAGLMGALLFYSSPLVGLLSCKSGVELGQTYFQFLAIYALAVGLNDQGYKNRWLFLSGIAMGLAMGTKYTAWPLLGLMALVLLLHSVKEKLEWKMTLKNISFCVVPAALLGAPWLVRNLVFYHNPIYPFFQKFFVPNGPEVLWQAMAAEGRSRNLQSLFTSWEGIKDFLLSPWLIDTQVYEMNCLGPILILGLPFLILFRYQGRVLRTFIGIALGFFWLLSVLTTMPRFFLPVIPFLALAYAVALEEGLQGFGKFAARIFFFGIVAINFLTTASYLGSYDAQKAIWGAESEESYLSRQHPSYPLVYYSAASYIRSYLPKNARVLVLGGGRGYGIGRDYVASPQFNESFLSQCLKKSETPETLRDCIKGAGFTHILFNLGEMAYRRDLWVQEIQSKSDVYNGFARRYVRPVFGTGTPQSFGQTGVWCSVGEIE